MFGKTIDIGPKFYSVPPGNVYHLQVNVMDFDFSD